MPEMIEKKKKETPSPRDLTTLGGTQRGAEASTIQGEIWLRVGGHAQLPGGTESEPKRG